MREQGNGAHRAAWARLAADFFLDSFRCARRTRFFASNRVMGIAEVVGWRDSGEGQRARLEALTRLLVEATGGEGLGGTKSGTVADSDLSLLTILMRRGEKKDEGRRETRREREGPGVEAVGGELGSIAFLPFNFQVFFSSTV